MMQWTASTADLSGVPRTGKAFSVTFELRKRLRSALLGTFLPCRALFLAQDGCAVFNAADRAYYLSVLACCLKGAESAECRECSI